MQIDSIKIHFKERGYQMIIKVVDYDQNWNNEYRQEEQLIRNILQKELVNSFHI